jgi:hypothetical protein
MILAKNRGRVKLMAVFLAVYFKNKIMNPFNIKACMGLFGCRRPNEDLKPASHKA